MSQNEKIKLGISACLLGEEVRFDGQHKYHWYLNEVLGKYFEYLSVCPEVEVGMGVPRKSLRLIGKEQAPRMIEPKSGEDWTERMNIYSNKKINDLAELSGFIFKKKSPSCGVFRVKVYQETGSPTAKGRGLFAHAFCSAYPLIPVEEEGRLDDAHLRENFIARVFGYQRLKNLLGKRFNRKDWVDFHTRHKFLLLSHSRQKYTELGRLVASIAEFSASDFKEKYAACFMGTLAVPSTPQKHSDVLMHVLGFLKKYTTAAQKKDLLESIECYRSGQHPLIVPVALLGHYVRVFEIPYVSEQVYFNPHPADLSLRNHV